MTVTSADVARQAGVSRATVSYVLNEVPGKTISDATRDRVRAAADELGYRPNLIARSLKRGRTDTLVVPLPGMTMTWVISDLLTSVSAHLGPMGLKVVPDFSLHEDPREQIDAWLHLAPAAVMDIVLRRDDPRLSLLRATGVPILSSALPDVPSWESPGDRFALEQRFAQMRHLISKGHEHIVGVYPEVLGVDPRTEKQLFADFKRMAKKAGVHLEVERVDLAGTAEMISTRAELPDAFACNSDEYALIVLTALQRRGVRVPEDVAVMGIDDLPIGALVTPALTTMRMELTPFARAIGEAVTAGLEGGRLETPLPPVAHLVIERESA